MEGVDFPFEFIHTLFERLRHDRKLNCVRTGCHYELRIHTHTRMPRAVFADGAGSRRVWACRGGPVMDPHRFPPLSPLAGVVNRIPFPSAHTAASRPTGGENLFAGTLRSAKSHSAEVGGSLGRKSGRPSATRRSRGPKAADGAGAGLTPRTRNDSLKASPCFDFPPLQHFTLRRSDLV